MPLSTRNQQIVQQAIEQLNRLSGEAEESHHIKTWLESLGISLQGDGGMFSEFYTLTQEQILKVAELEFSAPAWAQEPDCPLQHAVPGFYVAFLLSTGKHLITTVVETRTINRGSTTLLGLNGLAQGWYNLEGFRTTKDGQLFQGSAYAGRIFPVNTEILLLIERQELLTLITGYHQAYFASEGMLHSASNETLREISELLQSRTPQITVSADAPQS